MGPRAHAHPGLPRSMSCFQEFLRRQGKQTQLLKQTEVRGVGEREGRQKEEGGLGRPGRRKQGQFQNGPAEEWNLGVNVLVPFGPGGRVAM